jgi:membrane-associated protein
MDLFSSVIIFLGVHYYLAYVILFLGSFFDTLIGPGFIVPGEIFFLPGAILAGYGILDIWLVTAACIAGGLIGDSLSFFIGKQLGKKFVRLIFKKKNKLFKPGLYKRGKSFFHKYGKKSIFFARFMGPVSWVVPFIAGTAEIEYKSFLKYNVPGVIGGIGQFLIIGYLFGFSYSKILATVKTDISYLLAIIFIILIFFVIHKITKLEIKK